MTEKRSKSPWARVLVEGIVIVVSILLALGIDATYEVELEDGVPNVYVAGQAVRMSAESVTDARNASASETLKLAVFQVGSPHAPFSVPVKPTP